MNGPGRYSEIPSDMKDPLEAGDHELKVRIVSMITVFFSATLSCIDARAEEVESWI